jgi:hypothetical protein
MVVSEIVMLTALWALQRPTAPPAVVFVCEHGAAKSVIADRLLQQACGGARSAVSSDVSRQQPAGRIVGERRRRAER